MARGTAGKAGVWRERLRQFAAGDRTVGEFCEDERVSPASFYYWRKKLAAAPRAAEPAMPPPAFRPVVVTGGGQVAVELPGGARIELPVAARELVCDVVVALLRAGHSAGGTPC